MKRQSPTRKETFDYYSFLSKFVCSIRRTAGLSKKRRSLFESLSVGSRYNCGRYPRQFRAVFPGVSVSGPVTAKCMKIC